jgi:hypothetical protein
MKKILIFLLFLPTLVFAFDCDKDNSSYPCEYKTDGGSRSDFGQRELAGTRTNADSFLDTLKIIICTPTNKKPLLGKFAYPDTALTCYSSAKTTFQAYLSQLYDAGFRISQIESSGNKILYYMDK